MRNHPSVDFVARSPLWEPFLPLLEEWWHAVTEWWHTHSLLIPSFRRGDHRSPHIAPISRLCRLLPSTGAFFASPEERWHAVTEWWQHSKSNLYKINLNLFQKTIDKQKNVCYNELINQ